MATSTILKATGKVLFINASFLLIHLASYSQQVSGTIQDQLNKPIANTSVLLLHTKDSSLVKGMVTKENGVFSFEDVAFGSYMVSATNSDYTQHHSQPFTIKSKEDQITLGVLRLTPLAKELGEVTVTAKKPLFEQKIDRLVVNVANSITNTGSTALEVLMRSPGVTVNRQNNSLSMSGKDGVVIILNGKVNRMPADAMVQMLAGMSAANIERIELITTPPANLDAEGNAGFINIVLKKNANNGTNGTMSVTAGYGIDGGPNFSGSINFNHRVNRWNVYGDYSFYWYKPSMYLTFYRKVMNATGSVENFMSTDRDDHRRNHDARLGFDYEVNQNTIIGVLLSGFSNMYGMEAINNSKIVVNNNTDTLVVIDNPESHPLNNYSANINVLHHFQQQQQLSINLDYMYFNDANSLHYLNDYYNGNNSFLYSEKTRSNKETPINFWIMAADYTKPLTKKIDMEAGLKATLSHFENDARVEREIQNNWTTDKAFTAKHNLDESILAAYTSFNIKINEKTTSKLGLRYEYTNSVLDAEQTKKIVDRHYGSWFPSVFLSHSFSQKQSGNLSYSRRITRPTFNDMAPFIYFVDPNTFFSGNPALQPAISNTIKGDYLLKRYIFSLSYTHEKNTITDFAPQVDPSSNKQTLAAENQKALHTVALTLSLPIPITKWWTTQNNIVGYWQQLRAIYKAAPLNISQRNVDVNTTHTFTLPKDFSIELMGSYTSGGLWGIYKVKPVATVNFAVQKKFSANMGTLTLNITDLPNPPHYKMSVNAPEHNLITNADLLFSVTTIKLTYTRKFGNLLIKENRGRSTGAEEERGRVKTN